MLVQLIAALVGLVLAGILLGLAPFWPLETLGTVAFLVGSAGLGLVLVLGLAALLKGALFGEGSRWQRFN